MLCVFSLQKCHGNTFAWYIRGLKALLGPVRGRH
jgi:hypothetical protein